MKASLLLLCFAIAACTQLPVAMPGGKVAHATMVGGKGVLSYDAQGRPIYTYNNEKSLQHFLQTLAALGASVGSAVVQNGKNASDALTAQQAQSQASALALQKDKEAAAQAALDAANKAAAKAAARAAGIPAAGG